jgi:hypothetical protein
MKFIVGDHSMVSAAILGLLLSTERVPEKSTAAPATIQQVEIAPLFYQPFACIDHPEGQLSDPGDALGTDCFVVGGLRGTQSGLVRLFNGQGSRNEDWFSWRAEVHAPFDGTVTDIGVNPVTNQPGVGGNPPASYIMFRKSDGTVVVYAHVMEIRVRKGERVISGQVVAEVGNNGTAKMPHVHVGAYLGSTPLQIRWDLRAEGEVPALLGTQ